MKRYKINRCIPFPGNQVEYWIFDREKEVETCGKIRIRSIARMICDTLNRANELHKQRNW